MTDKPENPQVFPELERAKAGDVELVKVVDKGMTLRDYFAGQALAGLSHMDITPEIVAGASYILADAMLKERTK